MKSPFSSWHTVKKFPYTSFMMKMYDFTSDSLTTECQKSPSVRLLCRGNAYREAAFFSPSHSSSIIAFQACIGKSLKLFYVWREQNAQEISWNPRLCPNWDHCCITKPPFFSHQSKQSIFSILTRSLHKKWLSGTNVTCSLCCNLKLQVVQNTKTDLTHTSPHTQVRAQVRTHINKSAHARTQSEISQQLLDGLPWHLEQTIMVPGGLIIQTLVNIWLFT